MKKFALLVVTLFVALAGITGCNGGSSGSPIEPNILVVVSPTTASMSAGMSLPFTATVSNDPSHSGVTWSVTGGGTLSNQTSTSVMLTTSSTPGIVTLRASSVVQPSRGASVTVNVVMPPTVNKTTLPDGVSGKPYSVTLTETGGVTPLTWSIASGTLPAGLTLNAAPGTITGTPSATGTSNFTVQLTDSGTPPASNSLANSINIHAPLVISSTTLPPATVGVAYSSSLSATGGLAPYSWSITAGSLPSGLTLNSSTGAISGTPSAAGTANFTVQVTDTASPSQVVTLPMSINTSQPLSISTGPLPDATNGVAYSTSFAAVGGSGALTWSVSSGALPAGLSLNSSTGAISGTPSALGSSSFTIHVADSSTPPQSASLLSSLRVNAPLVISGAALPNAISGVPYTATLSATGAVAPATWSVSAGTLPTGLSLNSSTGVISGTTAAAGTNNLTIKLVDSAFPPRTATLPEVLTVNSVLSISPFTFPDGVSGVAYSANPVLSGGAAPFVWSISAGSLPTGLSLNTGTGAVTGTPSATGTFPFTLQVHDSSLPQQTANQSLTMHIYNALVIPSSTLPDAITGTPYNASVNATGGATPLTWAITAGALPAGLSLNSATGAITGTSTAPGTSNFTIGITDSANPHQSKTQAFSIRTDSALVILPITLPNAIVSILYNTTLSTSGGVGPITWSISAGALPTGLSLNATTGVISGIPSSLGIANFTIQASDSSSPAQVKTLAVNIVTNPLLSVTSPTLPNAIVNVPYTATLTISGGVGPITWSLSSGTLPTGLTLNASTGVISGTVTSPGTANFTVQATDSSSPHQVATANVSIVTNSLLSIPVLTLPNAIVGVLYNTALSSTGGVGPIIWSVSAGTLPSGITLNASTGVLSGTILAAGTTNFTIKATDSSSPAQTATASVSIIANPLLTIPVLTLPNAVVGVLYNTTLSSTGGVGPITWTISAGALPSGITLNASTGTLSGTILAAGTSSFTLKATDSSSPHQTATVSVSIVANPLLTIPVFTLPNAIVGVLYNTTLSTTGGLGPITWSVSAGTLPTGVTLNASTGVLSGTILSVGTTNFTIKATDSSSPAQTATVNVSLVANPLLTIPALTLPNAIVGILYNTTLSSTGGVGPITWSISAGTLPAGVSLNASTGALSGTILAVGTSSFTVKATDSSSPHQTATATVGITTNSLLTIPTITIPDAVIGLLFNTSLSTTGGVGPITWSVSSGSLPAGLTLNASTGLLSGLPVTVGPTSFTVQATDSSVPAQTATLPITLNVYAQLSIPPVILPPALVGVLFNTSLSVTGGKGPYIWSIASGALPSGITLNANTGALSGIAGLLGSASFTVKVTDSENPPQSTTLALNLSINPSGTNNSLFNGNYAFLFQGFDASGPVAIAGSIAVDGIGNVSSGVLDITRTSGVSSNVSITGGSFALNSDNRGTLVLTTATLGTQNFRIAVDASGALGRFIEFDASAPGTIRGNGIIKKQNSAAFSNAALSGPFAFGFSGQKSAGGRSALIGRFVTDGAGGITTGLADANSGGTATTSAAIANTSTYNIAASGRGTVQMNVGTVGTVHGALYVVSANEIFFLRTDALSATVDLLSGDIVAQTGGPYSTGSLVGTSVLYLQGRSSATSTSVGAGLLVSLLPGIVTTTFDANDNGTVSSTLAVVGSSTISSATAGRGTLSFGSNNLTLYMIGPNSAFVMDSSNAEVRTGKIEGQSLLPISLSSLLGNYVEGSSDNTIAGITFESGVTSISSLGNLTGTVDTNALGSVLTPGNLLSGTLSLSLTTTGRLTLGNNVYYFISPTRTIAVELGSGNVDARILEFDQ